MSDRAAFIRAIVAAPDDDIPRLVFADWLEESGDESDRARAEFIRVQCESASLPADDPRRAELERREEELLRSHGRFFSPVPTFRDDWYLERGNARMNYPYGGQLRWHRGFPRWAQFGIEDYPAKVEETLTREAVFDASLEFYGGFDQSEAEPAWLTEVCASPRFALVGMLNLCDTLFCVAGPPSRFLTLIRSPHLTGLKHVAVFKDFIGLGGVRAMVESPTPFRLQSLSLGCIIEPVYAEIGQAEDFIAAVQLIAQSPRMASLEHLDIDAFYDAEGHGETIAAELLASPYLSPSLSLRFSAYPDTDRIREQLAQRFQLVREDS